MQVYPIMVLLAGRRVVVVGGGEVAARKVEDLIRAGALVTVIAPEINARIQALQSAHQENVRLVTRTYAEGDLADAVLVYAATGDTGVNQQAYDEATRRGILINAVDDPLRCSFYVPSSIVRGDLVVAVSTGGSSPSLAARLRRDIEKAIPSGIETVIDNLGKMRELLKSDKDFSNLNVSRRGELLKALVHDDSLLRTLSEELSQEQLKKLLAGLSAMLS